MRTRCIGRMQLATLQQELRTWVIRIRRSILVRPDERILDLLRLAGFQHVAHPVEWEHDWSLVFALIER
ncbi:hypothetical protein PIB30_011785 [Stylosanthes scabra]|uniref:Uncharacterized protein n=1 Tax=Stylosanthes scabra TaxID=79078 RepID=A0ABU6R5U1_9FABA|nr:hypothetical protein [Stylosanthes scabra]